MPAHHLPYFLNLVFGTGGEANNSSSCSAACRSCVFFPRPLKFKSFSFTKANYLCYIWVKCFLFSNSWLYFPRAEIKWELGFRWCTGMYHMFSLYTAGCFLHAAQWKSNCTNLLTYRTSIRWSPQLYYNFPKDFLVNSFIRVSDINLMISCVLRNMELDE